MYIFVKINLLQSSIDYYLTKSLLKKNYNHVNSIFSIENFNTYQLDFCFIFKIVPTLYCEYNKQLNL